MLQHHDFSKFNPMKERLLQNVDNMLATDIARLMAQIPKEEEVKSDIPVRGGAFNGVDQSPFAFGTGEGVDAGRGEPEWIVNKERYKWDENFHSLNPTDGKVTGAAAKAHMVKSKLPNTVLGKIWKLADLDKDGMLDADEFALANYLINLKLEGSEMPNELPAHLIPPSKRGFEA